MIHFTVKKWFILWVMYKEEISSIELTIPYNPDQKYKKYINLKNF